MLHNHYKQEILFTCRYRRGLERATARHPRPYHMSFLVACEPIKSVLFREKRTLPCLRPAPLSHSHHPSAFCDKMSFNFSPAKSRRVKTRCQMMELLLLHIYQNLIFIAFDPTKHVDLMFFAGACQYSFSPQERSAMLRTCALGLLVACAAPLAISAAPLAASSDLVCKLAAGPGDSCVAELTASRPRLLRG